MRFSQDAAQRATGMGKVTFTVYDAFGRVTRVGEAEATFSDLDPESTYPFERDSASWRSRMTYDDDGDVAGGDAVAGGPNYVQGRLAKVEESTDTGAAAEVAHAYAYDHLGNVRVKQVTIGGLTGEKTVEYVHDLAGRVTRLIYPDGSQARYAYDSAGRLSRVWDAQGRTLAAYTHTAAGNIDAHVVGDGIGTGSYTYNARDWVTGLDYAGRFRSTLTYDPAGNITRQVYRHGSAASKPEEYAYDDLYRITSFDVSSGGDSRDYAYDKNGNFTSLTTGTSTLTYNYSDASTPNRLDSTSGTGGQTYAYNPNGWMTRRGTDTVSYDYRGLTTGYGSARYLMDPDRRRVKKTVGTAVTYYLRGADGAVLAEYDGQMLSARYIYAGSRRIARVASSGNRYYLADHLGSTRALLDDEGAVTATFDYWPYGEILATSGAESTHFRFTGHERDSESGLDYMLERSYAFDIGRFTRPDPMADEYPGISPYAYANNNPLKYVDPDGRVVYSVNKNTGEIQRIGDRGGSRTDYFNVGTNNKDGGFATDKTITSARGSGSINSFRFQESNESTISAFVIPGKDITGFFLEPAGPSTVIANQDRRIPEGSYQLEPFSGATKKDVFRLFNEQVSKDRYILIHKGNKPFETLGCLMPGCTYARDEVKSSRDKFEEIGGYLNSKGTENVRLNIYNVITDEEQE